MFSGHSFLSPRLPFSTSVLPSYSSTTVTEPVATAPGSVPYGLEKVYQAFSSLSYIWNVVAVTLRIC